MTTREPAISAHRLTKYYGDKKVVDNLSFRVDHGTVYGLLGRNGAGKSTAIKMLLGMVHPDCGSASVLGNDSQQLTPATRARVAYLAEGHPFYAWMTVGDAIRFARPFYPTWNDDLLRQILDYFALGPKTKIRRLSRGQQAQVSLALALAPDPELLIMDDPTMGLDPLVRREFLESMIEIIQRRGRTIFLSTHILSDVERIADRVGVIVDGVLRVDCPTDYFKEQVRKVVLEFGKTPPEYPATTGVISNRQIGTRRELVLVGEHDLHRQAIESLGAKNVDFVELNLEEAFIEYTRGPRGHLPRLNGNYADEESTSR